jgi:hypothetical protein
MLRMSLMTYFVKKCFLFSTAVLQSFERKNQKFFGVIDSLEQLESYKKTVN